MKRASPLWRETPAHACRRSHLPPARTRNCREQRMPMLEPVSRPKRRWLAAIQSPVATVTADAMARFIIATFASAVPDRPSTARPRDQRRPRLRLRSPHPVPGAYHRTLLRFLPGRLERHGRQPRPTRRSHRRCHRSLVFLPSHNCASGKCPITADTTKLLARPAPGRLRCVPLDRNRFWIRILSYIDHTRMLITIIVFAHV